MGTMSRLIEEQTPAFGWHKPAEVMQALRDAYLKIHSLKADFDRMEEIPNYLSKSYSAVMKAAKLETGLMIQVPPFVNTGDKVKVDTSEARYVQRV